MNCVTDRRVSSDGMTAETALKIRDRVLSKRIINEGGERLGEVLRRAKKGEALSSEDKGFLDRIRRPLSAREVSKFSRK